MKSFVLKIIGIISAIFAIFTFGRKIQKKESQAEIIEQKIDKIIENAKIKKKLDNINLTTKRDILRKRIKELDGRE